MFGEDAGDRRERLRENIIKRFVEDGTVPVFRQRFVDETET